MRQSMTAFARAVEENQQQRISVEIKSLNHRFLEINTKLPEHLRGLENTIREKIQAAVRRGKVDVWITAESLCSPRHLHLNQEALNAWLEILGNADTKNQLQQPVWHDVLTLPGVLAAEDEENADNIDEMVLSVFEQALAAFIAMREREGDAIVNVLSARLAEIEQQIHQLEKHLPVLQEKTHTQLQDRLNSLKTEIDNSRFEQELVYLLAKMDVKEEMDRLLFHVNEANKTLQQQGAIGRRMDFLMQEFSREANTLGAKAGDNVLSQAAVDLKVLIEQMREQVQNLA